MIRGKAMGDKAGDMVELMTDILTRARLDDKVSNLSPAARGKRLDVCVFEGVWVVTCFPD